jgi:hypothetical protein
MQRVSCDLIPILGLQNPSEPYGYEKEEIGRTVQLEQESEIQFWQAFASVLDETRR